MSDTIIDLIRHGEPVGGRLYRGNQVDDPLSETGWQQMWNAAGDFSGWQHIVTSPMKRCSEFAQKLSEKNFIPVTTEDTLKEVGFGTWEGRSREQIMEDNLKEYEDFYRDPINCRPLDSEPIHDFINRVSSTYDEIVKNHLGKHTLIVAHAGVIRAIIVHLLKAEPASMYRIQLDNAKITRVKHNRYGAKIELINGRI